MHYYQRPAYSAAERHERRTSLVRYAVITTTLLLVCALLSLALPGCSAGPTAEQRAEHAMPAR
ncbi:hypothetical protein D0N36_06795 [Hymenobacter lapidiphilus]|uniref:hypothetical protein n=1 Tax=Hymenobacter sp. CCM 8763 TaxID=2303334 RepID=UPI000E34F9A5|nr:hypothetical protein [Hymenobacter sp. CCM 8763]RFP65905.1 hypothetical protein D0N36_06795 [Hymenobacter sp. CCM 8763]